MGSIELINELKGNPIAALAGAGVGYYYVNNQMKSAKTIEKALVVFSVALSFHVIYVALTTKKNEPVIYNGGLPPVQGVRQTPVYNK